MEKFGVHKDLDSYKKVLNVFPKGKYVPENRLQADFFHYPKQQDCCTKIMGKFKWKWNGRRNSVVTYVQTPRNYGYTHTHRDCVRA